MVAKWQQKQRVALVTGAAHGIGREVARQLAAQSHIVILSARGGKAQSAVDELQQEGYDARALDLDITDEASVSAAARTVADTIGRLDVLVNNAAAFVDWSETVSSADLVAVQHVVATNLFGTWRVSQAFLPLLHQSPHPRLVVVSSGAGSHGDPQFGLTTSGATASYGISKAALNALVAKLAAELADTAILVNAVCPGLTATAPGMEAMGARPVADGAASVVWAAMLPDDGPRGGFFRDGRPVPW